MRRLPMRKIAEALRLKAAGLSTRKIASSLGLGQSTVSEYLKRAERAGLSWPLPEGTTDTGLEHRLFQPAGSATRLGLAAPDWAHVHRELRRKNVTLSLLWEEYRAAHPDDGYGYSRFCELYRRWEGRISPTMRQHHVAGERAFVDFAGDTIEVICAETGEVRQAQLFVGVLGASSYTYAEAVWTQTLPDWISAHVRMLSFFGGVPEQLVSDNLRAGITKACFYEPKVHRTYADLAAHYGTAVIPARPYKPRDKAKVEVGVQFVQRWIAAALRNRRFRSLTELNTAIRELLERVNGKVSRHLGASRRTLLEALDRPALRPLPAIPYEYAEWVERKVGLDYHVEIERHYYSVPHQLLKCKVWARVAARTVEVFHEGQRVASHVRTSGNRQHSTVPAHMPASHRRYAGWTPAEIRRRADQIGPNTGALVDLILRTKTHPEQGFRACLGIVRLAKSHGCEALEAACERAIEIGGTSYSSVNSILKNNLHRKRPETPADGPAITHTNIRGAGYFH
ncbi:IS21 family transposase [Roseivivax sp. THAF30]|uniref:IS21 family transposase n=1 Tax=Roseivivax sp. THAF30 TaxID=2587852 RepID=UPI0012680BFD|nr:IS21 family transposase [Roseivivax sp. THAF30]QFT61808.1 Integrase core domain protein [Roseivivax sp. THAF30]